MLQVEGNGVDGEDDVAVPLLPSVALEGIFSLLHCIAVVKVFYCHPAASSLQGQSACMTSAICTTCPDGHQQRRLPPCHAAEE